MNAVIVFILRVVLLLLSYLFLGWIGYTIFSDLYSKNRGARNEQVPPITLHTRTDQQTLEKQFSSSAVVIGRDPACDFPINEETISLRHCKLSFHHKHWWAEDLDSTNGTTLNGHIINKPTIIANGDELGLGQLTLTIQIN
ncbi:MAG: FHA domain-containing protein [Chloroflexota bacterium]|jgi:pSer/pThr/pTyr-binding forkhead associated (FHA) protein|nr:FHA domain-containing protein [Chloroflexota bacterium]